MYQISASSSQTLSYQFTNPGGGWFGWPRARIEPFTVCAAMAPVAVSYTLPGLIIRIIIFERTQIMCTAVAAIFNEGFVEGVREIRE